MPYKTKEKLYEAQRRHRERNKQLAREYLESHPCVDCGNDDIRVLDFDHVRGTKTKAVGRMITGSTYSWERILKEIEKCEVRCANCHRIKIYTYDLDFDTYRCN